MLPCTVHGGLWAGDPHSAADDIRPHHQLPGHPGVHVPCRQGRAGSAAELWKLKDDQWREGKYPCHTIKATLSPRDYFSVAKDPDENPVVSPPLVSWNTGQVRKSCRMLEMIQHICLHRECGSRTNGRLHNVSLLYWMVKIPITL